MDTESFGNKIKILRKQNNMTQDDLAIKLHVTRQAISNWERGITIPDINMITEISNVFAMGIDEIISNETKKVEKQYDRKATRFLYMLSIILVVTNIIISYLIYKEVKISTIFPVIIIMLINTTIFFTFGNAIKNDDYSIIAGFDRKIDYNMIALKKMLYSIENHIMISSIVFISIFIILGYIHLDQDMGGIILLAYIAEFITSIMLINIKNQDYMFKNNEDILIAKKLNIIVIIFIGFIFLLVGTIAFTFKIYNIENNSIEAIKMIGIAVPYIILSIVFMFNEQKNVKESIKRDEVYKPSKATYISIITCMVLLVTMLLVARSM